MLERCGSFQFGFDHSGVFADQNQLAHSLANKRRQRRIGCFLATASKDQDNLSRIVSKRFQGFQRRINTGGFRIIEEPNAVDLSHEFQSMLNRLKFGCRPAQAFRRRAARQARR